MLQSAVYAPDGAVLGLVRGAPQVTGPIDLLWYTGRALGAPVPEGTIHLVCPQKMRPRRQKETNRNRGRSAKPAWHPLCCRTCKRRRGAKRCPDTAVARHCFPASSVFA